MNTQAGRAACFVNKGHFTWAGEFSSVSLALYYKEERRDRCMCKHMSIVFMYTQTERLSYGDYCFEDWWWTEDVG